MITVYSTKTCPWCTKVKEYLEGKKIPFEVIDVASDREAAMEMVKKNRADGRSGDEDRGKVYCRLQSGGHRRGDSATESVSRYRKEWRK